MGCLEIAWKGSKCYWDVVVFGRAVIWADIIHATRYFQLCGAQKVLSIMCAGYDVHVLVVKMRLLSCIKQ